MHRSGVGGDDDGAIKSLKLARKQEKETETMNMRRERENTESREDGMRPTLQKYVQGLFFILNNH